VLREVFGEYRGPDRGVGRARSAGTGARSTSWRRPAGGSAAVEERLGRKLRILVGKPGLDGHSNGAEQVAIRARDLGMEVIYEGIRLTPAQIVRAAVDEDVHVVGLSILSGSHLALVPQVLEGLRAEGHDIPVVAGGIIPPADAEVLRAGPASPRCSPPRTTSSPTCWPRSPSWREGVGRGVDPHRGPTLALLERSQGIRLDRGHEPLPRVEVGDVELADAIGPGIIERRGEAVTRLQQRLPAARRPPRRRRPGPPPVSRHR
jgi:methylmalonyl-CoA mutase cobalamin-binding domain/chain